MGRKFAGSAGSFFLYTRIERPHFQHVGIDDVFQHSVKILCSMVLRTGHRLSMMLLIWSKEQLLDLALAFAIAFVISLYDGGVMSKGIRGSGSFKIQLGKVE